MQAIVNANEKRTVKNASLMILLDYHFLASQQRRVRRMQKL